MDLSFILTNIMMTWILIKLGKVLIPLNAGFLVPVASEFSMAGALLAFACCPQLITPITLLLALSALLPARKSGDTSVIYLKVLSYTISLLALSFISYSYYETVKAFLTGFIYTTPELTVSALITAFTFLIYWIEYDKVVFSIFDYEFSLSRGMNPKLWIILSLSLGVMSGITLTFIYGFLLAHVAALSSLLLGYLSKSSREEVMLWILVVVLGLALSIKTSPAYAFAVSSFAVLLLWKAFGKLLSKVQAPSM